jgi:hypothetical protein
MTSEMNNVAMASDDIMVNTKNLVAAQNTLNGMFGTTVQFSGQMAEDFVSLQTRLGLSEEAMKGFTQLTMNNGKGLKENFNEVSNTVLKLNQQKNSILSQQIHNENEIRILESKIENKNYLPFSVKKIMENKNLNNNGILADLIDFDSK